MGARSCDTWNASRQTSTVLMYKKPHQGPKRAIRLLPLPLAFLAAAGIALSPSRASAQSDVDKATARDLAIEGQAALDKGDFQGAEDRFRRAESLFHAPTITLGHARALVGLGKFVAAREEYNRIIRE